MEISDDTEFLLLLESVVVQWKDPHFAPLSEFLSFFLHIAVVPSDVVFQVDSLRKRFLTMFAFDFESWIVNTRVLVQIR